jgi:superfamily I DNA/RNA helicase
MTPTPEQRHVIDLPCDAKAMVLAGPGTGKTYTLLQRAAGLVADQGLESSGLLVLSFTRAVVRELRRRDQAEEHPARILPETFDSFASRLLRETALDASWEGAGYDGRIAAATAQLREGAAAAVLAGVRHVLVDEVQDLVGVRAELVAALLDVHAGGWTAFGDPAQAIYDHERGRRDDDHLIARLGRDADERTFLTRNHRAAGHLAEVAERLRRLLMNGDGAAAPEVWDAYRDLETVGDVDALAAQLHGIPGSFAILCRDNATALQCSDALHLAGVDHRVRRGTADRPVAGWLGAVVRGRSTITRDVCAEAVARLGKGGFPDAPVPADAWRLLARMDRNSRGGAVRVAEIGSRLSLGRVPWELLDEPEHRLTVSSIHRAKGLEFDQCAVAEWRPVEEADEALEGRVLYVALTRARADCFHLARDRRRRWFRDRPAQDRFIKVGRERWNTFGIEIRGDDVDGTDPGGAPVLDEPAAELQERLITQVRPGDEVTLEFVGDVEFSNVDLPCYVVRHAAGAIGVTGESFGRALRTRLRSGRRPQAIGNIRVDHLETIKGSPDVGDAAGLGRSGIWLRPRLVGLGEFDWS